MYYFTCDCLSENQPTVVYTSNFLKLKIHINIWECHTELAMISQVNISCLLYVIPKPKENYEFLNYQIWKCELAQTVTNFLPVLYSELLITYYRLSM